MISFFIRIFIRIGLAISAFSMFYMLLGPEAFADQNIFGSGSEAQAKQKIGSAVGRVFEFLLWIAVACGLVSFAGGLAMSNGFIGDSKQGQSVMKTGIVVALVGTAGVALKSLIGWMVGG